MVEIGRTLMAEPKVLLVDEPTAGLSKMLSESGFRPARYPAPSPPVNSIMGTIQAGFTVNAATLRSSRLNSTPIRWIGCPRCRYPSA